MIGDAYFQLRAQAGTALFSLLRVAAEAGADEASLAALRAAQAGLRETFVFLALGLAGSGKSTFLNNLFEREFCGPAEPGTAGKMAVFQHGAEARDLALSDHVVQCERPHRFLRDFLIIDPPGLDRPDRTLLADLAPWLPRVDAIFVVMPAANPHAGKAWGFLRGLGREARGRAVFVIRRSEGDGAESAAQLREAMRAKLGQACPIFAASAEDHAGREKLVRWIEREVIFSAPRRARLAELSRRAQETLRELAAPAQAAEESWQRTAVQLRRLRVALAEREEQSQRQIAGALWTLAQTFDALRKRGQALLRPHLRPVDLLRPRGGWRIELAREVETQARASLAAQAADALDVLGGDLRKAAAEHLRACRRELGEKPGGPAPSFPRAELAAIITHLEAPLNLESVLAAAPAEASKRLRLPVFAAAGAAVITLGALPFVGWVAGSALLAGGGAAFSWLLAHLLREQVVAAFGRHFTANRAALLTEIETPLRQASEQFYAALAAPLDARLAAHDGTRERHEPLLARLRQLEETFTRFDAALHASGHADPAEEAKHFLETGAPSPS